MGESEGDGIVGLASVWFGGERVRAYRRPDRPQPLLPFLGALWLPVGVQEKGSAERAPAVLSLEQTQQARAERGLV
ncbi:hypothetical protein ACFWDX_59140, partial [Streptomyces mirabilis]|uniref:hypothetical protein n=1 Tax=Streptomyces mirabilis TaxID=68239 RepID=UPI0036571E9A